MPPKRNANRRRIANNQGRAPSVVPNNVPDEANVQEAPTNDALYSDHLMQQYQVNVLDVFKKRMENETRKREAAEARVAEKNRTLFRVIERCKFYYNYNVDLQKRIRYMGAGGGGSNNNGDGKEEEVASNFKPEVIAYDRLCRNCWMSMANMVWQPCRHLSVCARCDAMLKLCPICGCAKRDGFKVIVSKS